LNWALQQDEIQVKAAAVTLPLPTEDNKLAERAPPMKYIMYLYPSREKRLFGGKMRHIMPPQQS
jgi:hypothetical protein